MSPQLQVADPVTASAVGAVRKACNFMLRRQHKEGFWWEDLTADTTLESDYILFQLWLHRVENGVWNPPNRDVIDRAVASILSRQLEDGGFNIYPQGPSQISACCKAYFSLKVAGIPATDERMLRLRDRILALGGLQAANSYTKLNLSFFGLYPRDCVPTVPPEVMLLGNFIYEMSSWSRAIVIPLSIIAANDEVCPVPTGFTLEELMKPGVSLDFRPADKFWSLKNLFFTADSFLKLYQKSPLKSLLRPMSIKRCENWMLERLEHSDGLAAIYPPMMYTVMAMDVLGYAKNDPRRVNALNHFDDLMVDDDAKGFYFQPCFSVVWDTAIAAYAMAEVAASPANVDLQPALSRSADWLLTKECRRKGDWAIKRPNLEPSGWYFEFANEFYPDIDDTAMVLIGLDKAQATNKTAQEASARRAVNWLIGMQSKDGGWAAFDADNNWEFLSDVPFADHNAMLDPSCPDITGRVLDALTRYGIGSNHPAVRRGIDYLIKSQENDGSWYGRWGVDYIYGTFLALKGLKQAGVSDREVYVLRAGEWLRSIQNADGGWGESCASYDDHYYVGGPSTASQTAWAVMGLMAGGDTTSESLRKGIEYLIDTQLQDGNWSEELATGTGFPKVFYMTYHMYRNAFPMMALAMYLNRGKETR
ncbi:squalene--hopene cyclase [Bryobacter aggregatus]|uniref:squalene--hopene cyclase n=1 Tax=Bryobacter aggregatus TaxID=360054 RepID=UPI000567382C|nr:squalene--hopene cyclase [Bryobacter aggregatus]